MKTLQLTTASNFVKEIRIILATELKVNEVVFYEKELTDIFNKLVEKQQVINGITFNSFGSDINVNFWSLDGNFLNIKIIDTKTETIKHIDFKIVIEKVSVKDRIIERVTNKYKGLKFKAFIKDCKDAKNPEELFNRVMEFVGEDTSSTTTFKRGEFTVYTNISIDKSNESIDLNLSIKDDEGEFSMKFDFHSSKEGLVKLYNKVEEILSKFE